MSYDSLYVVHVCMRVVSFICYCHDMDLESVSIYIYYYYKKTSSNMIKKVILDSSHNNNLA